MVIRNILVPIDGSKNSFRGLDNAIYIARQCHAVITGLYVIYLISEPKKGDTFSPIGKMLMKDARQSMEKAKIRSAQNGILFKSKIVYGDPGPKIVDFARKNGFDLIVIGSMQVKVQLLNSKRQKVEFLIIFALIINQLCVDSWLF